MKILKKGMVAMEFSDHAEGRLNSTNPFIEIFLGQRRHLGPYCIQSRNCKTILKSGAAY
jgi:hypothetical protein